MSGLVVGSDSDTQSSEHDGLEDDQFLDVEEGDEISNFNDNDHINDYIKSFLEKILSYAKLVVTKFTAEKKDEVFKKFQHEFIDFAMNLRERDGGVYYNGNDEEGCGQIQNFNKTDAITLLDCFLDNFDMSGDVRDLVGLMIEGYEQLEEQIALLHPKTDDDLMAQYGIADSVSTSRCDFVQLGIQGIPSLLNLTTCTTSFDRTHDAYGSRIKGLKSDEILEAKRVSADEQEALRRQPQGVSQPPSHHEGQLFTSLNNKSYATVQMIADPLSDPGNQEDGKVKSILRKVCEDTGSLIQYFTVCSFMRFVTDDVEERGIVIVALPPNSSTRDHAKSMAVKLFSHSNDVIYSTNNGSAETLLLLQAQPFIFNKLKRYMAQAATNAAKTIILSSFYDKTSGDDGERLDGQDDTRLRINERRILPLRDECVDAPSFEISGDTLPVWKSPLEYLQERANSLAAMGENLPVQTLYHLKENMYHTTSSQPTLTEREEEFKARYEEFKAYCNDNAVSFPGNFIRSGGRRGRKRNRHSFSYLDPDMLIFCPQFSQVDMHSGGNPLTHDQSLANIGLTTTWPMNGCTPSLGQTLGLRMFSETTPTVVDLAAAIFKAGWVDGEWRTIDAALNYETPDGKFEVSLNSCANSLLAGLGFYCPEIYIPQVSNSDYPAGVGIILKTDGATDENAEDTRNKQLLLLPALISEKMGIISADQVWPALISMLDNNCGSEVSENSCASQDKTGISIGTIITDDSGGGWEVMSIQGDNYVLQSRTDGSIQTLRKNQMPEKQEKKCACGRPFVMGDGSYSNCFYPDLDFQGVKDKQRAQINWCACHGRNIFSVVPYFEHSKIIDLLRYLKLVEGVDYNLPPQNVTVALPLRKSFLSHFGTPKVRAKKQQVDLQPQDLNPKLFQARAQGSVQFSSDGSEGRLILTAPLYILQTISARGEDYFNGIVTGAKGAIITYKGSGLLGKTDKFILSGTLPTLDEDGIEEEIAPFDFYNLTSMGLGMCTPNCCCKGLCMGNKLLATIGVLFASKIAETGNDQGIVARIMTGGGGLAISALIMYIETCFSGIDNVNEADFNAVLQSLFSGVPDQLLALNQERWRQWRYVQYGRLLKSITTYLLTNNNINDIFREKDIFNQIKQSRSLEGTVLNIEPFNPVGPPPEDHSCFKKWQNINRELKDYEKNPDDPYYKAIRTSCILIIGYDFDEETNKYDKIICISNLELGGGEYDDDEFIPPYYSCEKLQEIRANNKNGTIITPFLKKEEEETEIEIPLNVLSVALEGNSIVKKAIRAKEKIEQGHRRMGEEEMALYSSMERATESARKADEQMVQSPWRNIFYTTLDMLQKRFSQGGFAASIATKCFRYKKDDILPGFEHLSPNPAQKEALWDRLKQFIIILNENAKIKNLLLVKNPTRDDDEILFKSIAAESLALIIFTINRTVPPGNVFGRVSLKNMVRNMITLLKTDGDLQQMALSLQLPGQTTSEFKPVNYICKTGDFSGATSTATILRQVNGEIINPNICLTARLGSGGASLAERTRPQSMNYLPLCIVDHMSLADEQSLGIIKSKSVDVPASDDVPRHDGNMDGIIQNNEGSGNDEDEDYDDDGEGGDGNEEDESVGGNFTMKTDDGVVAPGFSDSTSLNTASSAAPSAVPSFPSSRAVPSDVTSFPFSRGVVNPQTNKFVRTGAFPSGAGGGERKTPGQLAYWLRSSGEQGGGSRRRKSKNRRKTRRNKKKRKNKTIKRRRKKGRKTRRK